MVVKGTRRGFWRVPLRGWSELKKVLGCLDQLGGWPCCEQEAEVETLCRPGGTDNPLQRDPV